MKAVLYLFSCSLICMSSIAQSNHVQQTQLKNKSPEIIRYNGLVQQKIQQQNKIKDSSQPQIAVNAATNITAINAAIQTNIFHLTKDINTLSNSNPEVNYTSTF